MKKLWIFLALIPLIIGCANRYRRIPSDTPTPNERLCRDLKRNITFNATSSLNINNASPTEEAEMIRSYNKLNCSRFE